MYKRKPAILLSVTVAMLTLFAQLSAGVKVHFHLPHQSSPDMHASAQCCDGVSPENCNSIPVSQKGNPDPAIFSGTYNDNTHDCGVTDHFSTTKYLVITPDQCCCKHLSMFETNLGVFNQTRCQGDDIVAFCDLSRNLTEFAVLTNEYYLNYFRNHCLRQSFDNCRIAPLRI